ncbi:hypothetical protein SY88_06915 [Clostridiales bacterium PH28_bin88]|nr:hypothetical protein SY88_06915 [Clostridiales bacterium PH28_bin88]
MIRLVGAGLVVVAAGWLGLVVANNYSRRPQQLRALRSALTMLETEIVYTATPLPEALARVARCTNPPVSNLFWGTHEALGEGRGYTAAESWEVGLGGIAGEASLLPQDLEVLRSFGHSLGSSGPEDQVRHLQLAREQLKQLELAAEVERAKNERLWRTMGFLVGLMLVLVLY